MTQQRTYTTGEVGSLVRGNILAWGVTTIVFCAIPSALVFIAVPKFRELFRGFGADLPDMTQFLLDWRYLLWVLPVLAISQLIFGLAVPEDRAIAQHRGLVGAFAATCCASLLIQGLAVAALYAPIFRLGAVI